jgi:hypothetical protein
MNHTKVIKILFMFFAVVLCFGCVGLAAPIGTAFTYQGRLIDANNVAEGLYDFQFKLFDVNSGGIQWGLDVNRPQVDVIDGYFTVELDFGNVFDGNERWLDIAVRPGDQSDPNVYTSLTPRQKLTPTPYALYAPNGGGAGSLWQVNGSSIYYNIGNFGIGETNPTDKLVVGQGGNIVLKAAGEDTGDMIFQTSSGVQKGRIYTEPAEGQNKLYLTTSSDNNTPGITIDSTGNVGIGTDSPGTKLEVAGQVKIADGSQGAGKVLTSDGTGLATWQTPASSGLSWVQVAGTSQQAVSNTGYIANNAAQVTITLPASPTVGDVVRVSGAGAGGWKVAQNADQSIPLGGMGLAVTNTIWTEETGTAGNRNWYSVASSSDGTKLVAAVYGGQIYTSTDSGVTWNGRGSSRNWYSVASSSDGTKFVAVANNGQIYTSTDFGYTWTARESNRNWQSVASSSDGTKLVAVVNNGQIYTSADFGVTWTARESSRSWQSVASSSDGTKLVAVVNNGQIYNSTNSGVNWMAQDSNRTWYSVASSSDGTKLVAVVNNGQIYTSTASTTTTTGTLGYLTGEQYAAIELQYIDGGQWMPLSYAGSMGGF